MRWHSVAVVALVLLAGCNAFAFSGSTAEPTATLTPVPVSTPGETRTVPDSAPAPPSGVSIDGAVDADALLAAHEAALDDRNGSFTWVGRFDLTVGDDARSSMEYERRIEADGDAFLVQHVTDGRLKAELYATPSTGYRQSIQVGERTPAIVPDAWPPTGHTFTDDLVRRHFDGDDVSVALVERNGEAFYRIHATRAGTATREPGGREPPSGYTATAYVTPEGLIRTTTVNYDRTADSPDRSLSFRSTYSAVGETTVARPDWVDWVVSRTSGNGERAAPPTGVTVVPASTPAATVTVAPPTAGTNATATPIPANATTAPTPEGTTAPPTTMDG